MKTLVLFYSRTGTTEVVAKAIADGCGGDLERLRDRTSRAGAIGYCRSFVEATFGLPGATEPTAHDPAAYDLVVIGTPVWCSAVSSPVRAWLAASRGRLPRVAFFCTFGGTGSRRAFAQMARLAGRQPVGTLDVRVDAVTSGAYVARVLDFTRQLAADSGSRGRDAAASPAQTASAAAGRAG